MQLNELSSWPRQLRLLVVAFVLSLNIGFFTGFSFVRLTTSLSPSGIERNYLGNESDLEAEVMQFRKSEKEVLTLIHNHILSLSILFFILGMLVYATNIAPWWKSFLAFEPFVSLVLTFGGIYVMWSGWTWFKFVVMLSGMAMLLSILLMSFFIIRDCFTPKKRG